MSKKKVTKVCKLQFQAGGAKPGPALASAGINMPQFCTAFNDATKDRKGDIVPVVITAYEDKSFDFVLKTTPAANLLKKAANVQKASGDQKVVAGTITVDQLKEIAEYKYADPAEAMTLKLDAYQELCRSCNAYCCWYCT